MIVHQLYELLVWHFFRMAVDPEPSCYAQVVFINFNYQTLEKLPQPPNIENTFMGHT